MKPVATHVKECGCVIECLGDFARELRIDYCRMHSGAAELRVAALKAQRALNELMGDSSAYAWDDNSIFGDALRHLNSAVKRTEAQS